MFKLFFIFIGLLSFQSLTRAEVEFLPIKPIPGLNPAAESYFSPDSQYLIFNAKLDEDPHYYVYLAKIDGSELRKINSKGEDGCSYFFPQGDKIIWTSTRDLEELGGNYSDPQNYPQGAELYISDLWGKNMKRITHNNFYDAEVSISPNGHHILFTRQINGQLDLWMMDDDGSNEHQITFTSEWQEGGSFFMPDNETIIFRAWKKSDESRNGGLPMTLFTIKKDGTALQQITHQSGTHWAPYPAPDGKHIVYVKLLENHNYDIFLMNLQTGEEIRLTYHQGFDGFPSISPDGKLLSFSSSREARPMSKSLALFTMDISSLNLKPMN